MSELKEFGLIGMGVMGTSLARNLARKGFKLALYNRYEKGVEEKVAEEAIAEHDELSTATGFEDMKAFVAAQSMPRKIFLMIKAGKVTDYVINDLAPLLDEGDIIIDGGNSLYKDTERRIKELKEKGLHFIGTGVSGGERGALEGPSIMPSGDAAAYEIIAPYLTKIAAKDKDGKPCCTYVGKGGSGHFIKMVHNGIEYAEMQLIAESYALMRYAYGMSMDEIAAEFTTWQAAGLSSYLLEISTKIIQQNENGGYIIDAILDKAGNKGTGSWTTDAATDYGVPATVLTSALYARYISAFASKRSDYETYFGLEKYKLEILPNLEELRSAYALARMVNHQQGFELMKAASDTYDWGLNFSEIARIWTNGCIIRSELMESLVEDFETGVEVLRTESRKGFIMSSLPSLKKVAATAIYTGVSVPCTLSAIDFLNAHLYNYPTANMIQAQRDFFGAHTFQRVGDDSGKFYHFEWEEF
ncbi:MAG: 6-phosphogluconate dehydrogenase [Spirosomataceae bacterium]|jgi:6-phosphogluconate dehydrogenase